VPWGEAPQDKRHEAIAVAIVPTAVYADVIGVLIICPQEISDNKFGLESNPFRQGKR
jgi:hypothetical protein